MPKLNGESKFSFHLIADENQRIIRCNLKFFLPNSLDSRQIRRLFFKKYPSYRSLVNGKTVPPFSNFTARKQKEKAAIAACNSRFDSGFYGEPKNSILVIIYQPFNDIQTNSASLFFVKTCDNVCHGFGTPIYFQLLLSASNGCVENPVSYSF